MERFTKLWSDQFACMVQRPGQQRQDKKHDNIHVCISKRGEDAQMDVRSYTEG